ncbi:hypothetical protein [Halobacteriovorax sp. HLS]|uniref:hypothetical protein n=1 Tax=Halobacteriovorax sp. HLS TaxID=2234000 RepID=UPI000FD884C5|nr:hypothetical protein [Halobacteriovorax sp. HLS]
MKKFFISLCLIVNTFAFEVPPPYESGANSGENKLDRLDRVESYLNSMSSILGEIKTKLNDKESGGKLMEKLKEVEEGQKQLADEFKSFKQDEFKKLELRVDFIDKDKVEKIIDRFNLYKSDTDRKISVLKESIKELEALVRTVDSPYKK